MENKFLQPELNIGMIGHVDHGKTSLTKALTGKWTDTHSEELKRGISIRIGYANFLIRKCEKCKGFEAYTTKEFCERCGEKTTPLRKISIVDAPGHETLITTMLSGAALMHGVILVVAANEKIPQQRTIEHLLAVKASGIKNIVVALNKVDLVDREELDKRFKELKKFLGEYDIDAKIIPTSAHFSLNIDALLEAIEKNIPTPRFDLNKKFKMYIARSFDINRVGQDIKNLKGGVIGGGIVQGKLRLGEEIEISPGYEGKKVVTKAVSLNSDGDKLEEARPGGLVAIGTLMDMSMTKNDGMRGNVAGSLGSLPEPAKKINAEIRAFKRAVEKLEEVKKGDILTINIGTATTIGKVKNMEKNIGEIELSLPVVAERNDKIAILKRGKQGWRLVAYGKIV